MLNPPPPTPLVRYRAQDADHDELMDVPIRRFDHMAALRFEMDEPARYVVNDPAYSLPLDVLFIPRPGSQRLLVGLHGAEGRAQADLPKFQFVRSFSTRKDSLLFIADSTLLQGEKINIGWYAGNRETPLQDLAAAAVIKAGRAAGVSETVLIGHSAGGFGAILIGSKVPNSRAISVNGQSVVSRYEPWTVENLRRDAFPECATVDDMMAVYGHRLDLRVGLEGRLRSSSFTYFGNRADDATFGKLPHFPLLAEHFRLGREGGPTPHGDALVACDWSVDGVSPHAMPGTAMPFIALTLGEPTPNTVVAHSTSPRWRPEGWQDLDRPTLDGMSDEPDYFTQLGDDQLADIGMYRCACGKAVKPTGDSQWQHCDAAREEASAG